MNDEVAWLDATDQAELVRTGEVSASELVDGAIEHIERLNPELNAVIHPLFERARATARQISPGDGPFVGVPFLLKDLGAEMAGTPFCEGSALAGDYLSIVDQELTKRFVRAGFVVCGKTNTPEFGILPTTEPMRFGASRNPWNPAHSTGGSSGGSAAAVASGMVPVAHANDGGGSIRIPASCCGLVGLKPTRARVSGAPLYGDVMGGLVVEHVVSRTVRDSAAILDAISGPVRGDPYWAPPLRGTSFAAAVTTALTPLRIGVALTSPTGSAAHADCVAAVEAAAALCRVDGSPHRGGGARDRRRPFHRAFRQFLGGRQRLGDLGLGGATWSDRHRRRARALDMVVGPTRPLHHRRPLSEIRPGAPELQPRRGPVLRRIRCARDPDPRRATRPDRHLRLAARSAIGRVVAAPLRTCRSLPCSTSPDSRPSRYRCIGMARACPLACSSSDGSATKRRCCHWPQRSRSPPPGQVAVPVFSA